jgi:hypothetical protein
LGYLSITPAQGVPLAGCLTQGRAKNRDADKMVIFRDAEPQVEIAMTMRQSSHIADH